MPSRSNDSFSLMVWVRASTNFMVSIDQPRTILVVIHLTYSLDNFFKEIGSSISLFLGLSGQNNSSMERNR